MLKSRTRKSIVNGTVSGVVFSIVLSIILVMTTAVESQVGLLIAMSGTLACLIISASVAFAERLDDLDAAVIDSVELRAFARMPQIKQAVVDISRHLQTVQGRGDERNGFFWEACILMVQEANDAISGMANGVVTCAAEQEIQYVERALRFTRKSVDAVASRGGDWWSSPEASVYWSVYGNAAQRLAIRRVFLIDELTENMKAVLARHDSLHMQTFWVPIHQVPAHLRRPVVLFDGTLLHRTVSSRQLGTEHVDFTDSARELTNARAQFDAILQLSDTQKWGEN